MQDAEALIVLSALAQSTRLKVVALLAERSEEMASGDIADAVGVPRNLMSAHLAILSKAGLLAASRSGREVRYSVDVRALVALNRFLQSLEISCRKNGPP